MEVMKNERRYEASSGSYTGWKVKGWKPSVGKEQGHSFFSEGKEEKIVNCLKTVLGEKIIGHIGESLCHFRALTLSSELSKGKELGKTKD